MENKTKIGRLRLGKKTVILMMMVINRLLVNQGPNKYEISKYESEKPIIQYL